jgi:hypothetical protein
MVAAASPPHGRRAVASAVPGMRKCHGQHGTDGGYALLKEEIWQNLSHR